MRKVLPGQSLKIPASTFNTMIDAASDYQRRRINRAGDAVPPNTMSGIVTIRNSSGANRDRFSVLGLSTVMVTPSQNGAEFASRFCFDAVLPAAAHAKKFVVLQAPIKDGAFGKAMIVGVTPVLMKRLSAHSNRVGIETGETYLKSGIQGAQILWEDAYTADELHLGVIRLPTDDGAGPVTACRFVTTDAAHPLSGLGDIDGQTPRAGDLVLRAADDGSDGIWEAAAGPWKKFYGLSDYTKGDTIAIWGGNSAPQVWIRMTADVGPV